MGVMKHLAVRLMGLQPLTILNNLVAKFLQGAGTRWPALITQENHPLHSLYNLVKNDITGISCGCADVFEASKDAKASGFSLIQENFVPGTTGLASFGKLLKFNTTILNF